MKNEKRYTTISIPVQLNEKLKEKISGTGFHSVSSYVIYVLRQLVSSSYEEKKGFTKEDEKRVRDRLKNLDYL
ncbi:CopG family transcriptional regulator [Patescibacteria group bacterium]|nr:CopG family transcriptional regulator [Patescibacteria group bacterium]